MTKKRGGASVIIRHQNRECPDIGELEVSATSEGYEFVERTRREWQDGTNRFDRPGECLYVAVVDGQVVGMCGVNVDPYLGDSSVGRLRHMYTHPDYRRKGVAADLVRSCQQATGGVFTRLRLRTANPEADALYRHLGFEFVDEVAATHSWQPRVNAAYDNIAEWYENEFLKLQRSTEVDSEFADSLGIDRALVELLGIGEGLCLEVGCGTGVYAERVRQLGWTPVGVDISSGMLGYAKQRLPVAQSDGRRLPFPDHSIPAVITVMTHTDVPNYAQMVSEIARVLKPGGIFVHVGVHPCFCGGFADRSDVANIVIRPGYLESGWIAASGPEEGRLGSDGQVRLKVGASHLSLAELLNLLPAFGLVAQRFLEGGEPTPITLSIRATT